MPSVKPAANRLTIILHHVARAILPAYWADASKADRELNWRVTRTLDEMAQDTALAVSAIHRDIPVGTTMTQFNPVDHPHRRYNPLTGQMDSGFTAPR